MFFSSCREYKRLGKYEKKWALKHPVASLKIRKIKKQCDPVYQSVKKHPDLDSFENGGKQDAFRHMYYMTMFASQVKPKKVISLGIAHEKDNYLSFLKSKNEEGELADSVSCEMDLLNNKIGVELAQSFKQSLTVKKASEICIEQIKKGNVYFIKRDEKGNYLKCNGALIKLEDYRNKWNIPKCLIQK